MHESLDMMVTETINRSPVCLSRQLSSWKGGFVLQIPNFTLLAVSVNCVFAIN